MYIRYVTVTFSIDFAIILSINRQYKHVLIPHAWGPGLFLEINVTTRTCYAGYLNVLYHLGNFMCSLHLWYCSYTVLYLLVGLHINHTQMTECVNIISFYQETIN